MSEATEHLRKIRAARRRLQGLLDAEERNVLVMAEVAHAAAHLAELVADLDMHLTSAGVLPRQWGNAKATGEGPGAPAAGG